MAEIHEPTLRACLAAMTPKQRREHDAKETARALCIGFPVKLRELSKEKLIDIIYELVK